jgi:hypothetical protein
LLGKGYALATASRATASLDYDPDETSLPHCEAVDEDSLGDPRWGQHFDSAPLDEHVENLRLIRPLALVQRQYLPARVLIPGP